MRVVVVGVSYVVTTLPVDAFPVEHTVVRDVQGITSSVAGPAFLTARTLAALGDEVYLASPLGEDAEGAIVDAAAYAYGLNTAMCPRTLTYTPRAVALEDGGGRRLLSCDLDDARSSRVEVDLGALVTAELLVLDDLQASAPLIAAAHAAGIAVAVDLGAVAGPPTLEQQAYLAADLLLLGSDHFQGQEEDVLRAWRERSSARLVVVALESGDALALPAGAEDVVQVPTRGSSLAPDGARAARFATLVHYVFGRGQGAAQAMLYAATAASTVSFPPERDGLSEETIETAAMVAEGAPRAPSPASAQAASNSS